jgi:MFS family permease
MKRLLNTVAGGLGMTVLSLLLPTAVLAQNDNTGAFGTGALCFGLIIGLVINIAILVWVTKDAQKRGSSAGAWLVIVLLFGILGLLAYLVARPKGKLVPCPECGKEKQITDPI